MQFIDNFNENTKNFLGLESYKIDNRYEHIEDKIFLTFEYDPIYQTDVFENPLVFIQDIIFKKDQSSKNKVKALIMFTSKRPRFSYPAFINKNSNFEDYDRTNECIKSISFNPDKDINKIKNDIQNRLLTTEVYTEIVKFIDREKRIFREDIKSNLFSKELSEIVNLPLNYVSHNIKVIDKFDDKMQKLSYQVNSNNVELNFIMKNEEDVKKLLKFWKDNCDFSE